MSAEFKAPSTIDELPKSIEKSAINRLPLADLKCSVDVIKTADAAEMVVQKLLKENALGFDTETRPSFKKGESNNTSIVQFSTQRKAYIFQLKQMESLTPLVPLFTAEAPKKAGVAIRDDIKGLQSLEMFKPQGFVEIADLSGKLGLLNTGLRPLAALLMGVRISKRAQLSNWAKPDLSPSQIQYAAMDAWISLNLYTIINKLLDSAPAAPSE